MQLPILNKNDVLCIVAPAGAITREDLTSTLDIISQQNWNVEFGEFAFSSFEMGYNYAATEEQRLHDLQWALDHPKAKAIWFARGGYGGIHLIDSLDFTNFYQNPKWVIGYSDNTIFHQFLSKKNIPSIHAATVKQLGDGNSPESYTEVLDILKDQKLIQKYSSNTLNKKGNITAKISGGNLSILYSLLGGNSIDDFEDKILFIEDWHENWYHLDRMLMSLDRANIFSKIKALLVGSFTKIDDENENPEYLHSFDSLAYNIIDHRLSKYSFPIAYNISSGHIIDNRPLLLGKDCTISIDEKGTQIMYL